MYIRARHCKTGGTVWWGGEEVGFILNPKFARRFPSSNSAKNWAMVLHRTKQYHRVDDIEIVSEPLGEANED
jgi:hypothetical protein